MNKLYLDVETSGLKGKLNLVQYKFVREEGGLSSIKLIRPFQQPEEMETLKGVLNQEDTILYGYNIGFDLWKLYQYYKCVPFRCQVIDLWLHVLRDNPLCYYPLRGKSIIVVKKIPSNCVDKMELKISNKLSSMLPDMFNIKVKHSEDKDNKELITLAFRVEFNVKLKTLVSKLFGEKTLDYDDCFKLPDWKENNRIPVILPEEQELYDNLWKINEKILDNPYSRAWIYSTKDVEYLELIENWLIKNNSYNEIPITDNDICTHIVAYTKYHGFKTNKEKVLLKKESLIKELKSIKNNCDLVGVNPLSNKDKKEFFNAHLVEDAVMPPSLDKKHLKIAIQDGILNEEGIKFFTELLEYQSLNQRLKQMEVFEAGNGMVYPDFRVYGTTTNRMAGTSGINFQGIARDGDIRELVYCSQGGDFDSLEIGIAASYFQDIQMLSDLDRGVDLHTQTACLLKLLPMSYEEAMVLKVNKDIDLDTKKKFKNARATGKKINFEILYFATSHKVADTLNIDEENAELLMKENFFKHYPQLLKTRDKYYKEICTADTTSWDRNSIQNMKIEVQDAVGNSRYLLIEKEIANYFWKNSNSIAKEIGNGMEGKIVRQEVKGEQTYTNALHSALLGAVIGIQNSLYRQCGNFPIQSTGASITKALMVKIWKVFHIPMMNVHDEIMIPSDYESIYTEVKKTVDDFVAVNKTIVKHLSMSWTAIKNWGEK